MKAQGDAAADGAAAAPRGGGGGGATPPRQQQQQQQQQQQRDPAEGMRELQRMVEKLRGYHELARVGAAGRAAVQACASALLVATPSGPPVLPLGCTPGAPPRHPAPCNLAALSAPWPQDAIEQAYGQDVAGQRAAAVRTYRTALDVLRVGCWAGFICCEKVAEVCARKLGGAPGMGRGPGGALQHCPAAEGCPGQVACACVAACV